MRKKISFYFDYNLPICKWWLFEFTLFRIEYRSLLWKDKFATPRCESPPEFNIIICNLKFTWIFGDDEYWEQWLWIHNYCDGDKIKAKATWPWVNGQEGPKKGVSTWID